MFNILRKKNPALPTARACDAAAVLAKLRADTKDTDLAALIDMTAASILRDHIPMLAAVKKNGIRLKRPADCMTLVQTHDMAFASLEKTPFTHRKPISANAREGGRAVAEIMDGVLRRALLLADDETSVNRMAYMRVMYAQSLLIEATDKLDFLPQLTKEQRDANSNPAA